MECTRCTKTIKQKDPYIYAERIDINNESLQITGTRFEQFELCPTCAKIFWNMIDNFKTLEDFTVYPDGVFINSDEEL